MNKPSQESYESRTMRENVAGILATYRVSGRIGKIVPTDEAHAKLIARGIAKSTRRDAKKHP